MMMNTASFLKIFILSNFIQFSAVCAFVQIPVLINRITTTATTPYDNAPDVLVCRPEASILRAEKNDDDTDDDDDDDDTNNNINININPDIAIPVMEKVWRYAKRALISVGGKGATIKHGNNLRQLLDDHTIVKVKVNTKTFGTLEKAWESLRDLAIESGASPDIEMIQMREKDRTILFGLPGTIEKVEDGSFPPPPPPPYVPPPREGDDDYIEPEL